MTSSEPVGSLAEEAAKLIAALQTWSEGARGSSEPLPADGDDAGDVGLGDKDLRDEDLASEAAREEPAEAAAAECTWCPLCSLVRRTKAMNPDVREHLTSAALSLTLAVKALLEESERAPRRQQPVEKIDLTDE